jgi:hypothetical protein
MQQCVVSILTCEKNGQEWLTFSQIPTGHVRITHIVDSNHKHIGFVSDKGSRILLRDLAWMHDFVTYTEEADERMNVYRRRMLKDLDAQRAKCTKLRKQIRALGQKPEA